MSGDRDFVRFDALPGFELVDYKRVGLPVYQVQIDVLTEERRELHLVGEYCLRLLQAGVSRMDDLIRLIGVSPQIVKVELADLIRLNAVAEKGDSLSTTNYGNEMLEPYGDMVCAEATWYVPFDGILRRPYPWRADQLRTTRQLADLGSHLEISPIGERPALREFEINAVSQVLSQLRVGGKDMDRLVSIRNVRKSPLRFVSAVALAYESKSINDEQVRVVFLIDGRPAPVHDDAFANGNGLRRPMFRPLGSKLDSETQMRATTRRRLVRSRSAASAPAALGGKLSLPGSEESAPDVRDLPVYKVRSRWVEAITSAATQLIITTRAVSQGYLQELLPNLTKTLELGVRVYLGIATEAIQINRDGKPLDLPIAVLTVLQKKFEGLTVQLLDQLTVTHLVIDNRVLLVGDYDWLTAEGSSIRQFRHTWMLETDNPAILEKETTRLLADFKPTNAK
jgi:hypothetical protein